MMNWIINIIRKLKSKPSMKSRISSIIYDLLKIDRSLELTNNNTNMCLSHINESILYLIKILDKLDIEFENEVVDNIETLKDNDSISLLIDNISYRIEELSGLGQIASRKEIKDIALFAYQSIIISKLWLDIDITKLEPVLKPIEVPVVETPVIVPVVTDPIISPVTDPIIVNPIVNPIIEEKEVSPVQEVSSEVVVPPTIDVTQPTINVPTTETIVNPDPANGTLVVDPSITDTTNSPTNTETEEVK